MLYVDVRINSGKVNKFVGSKKTIVRPGQIIKIYGELKRIGTCSATVALEARRHSPYNGSQKTVLTTEMTFVRVDGDGEAVPVGEDVKKKRGMLAP